MKKTVITILAIILPFVCFSQMSDMMKLLDKGEFDRVKDLMSKVYQSDTANSDYYYIFYRYYADSNNPDVDSLEAYRYLLQYNSVSKKKIPDDELAQSLLSSVYRQRNVERFNKYIELSVDHPELNKEATRIRNQIAYENLQESPTIEAYQKFVDSYPDAAQTEDALQWLNEHRFQYYMQQGNIDSLKSFAKTTPSESYKAKALGEIDRLAFTKALKDNTVDSYMAYIKEYPDGNYVKMARNNIEKVQYEQYVSQGSITDMMYYIDSHGSDDKNYREVFDKLSLAATEHYSLTAMTKIQQLQPDEKLLKQFAKRYISDLDLHDINLLISTFPVLEDDESVAEAKKQAEVLDRLKNKPKLTLEDYKKHKQLFKSLNARTAAKVFETFEELNSKQPRNKAVNFGLNNDYSYLQFKNAQNTEMKFVLTEAGGDITPSYKDIKIFAQSDTNGYGWYEGSNNRDIFVSLLENGKWSAPFALPSVINSRYDECNPVLSADKKTLWFSSDRGLNFGKKDIYVSFREDVNDWYSWSEPVLLGEDFNTEDDDYVVGLNGNILVISQDAEFKAENNIYLEGNTDFERISGKVDTKIISSPQSLRINIYDKQTLKLKNVTRPNEKGFFAFIKPEKDVLIAAYKRNYFSPLSENGLRIYSVEQTVSKQELITLESPFDASGNITAAGRKNLELLADCFNNLPYILTIGVHAVKPVQKMDAKQLSDKQASQIADILVKAGMSKDNVIVTGYGKENTVQGWEDVNSIDIGVIAK